MAWEQVSNAIKFYAFFVASKAGKSGLTPTVYVLRNGTAIVTAGNATEVDATNAPGLYSYELASGSVTVEGEYIAVFRTADATVDAQHIPSLWIVGRAGVEDLDATISSRLPTSSYTAPTTPPTVGAIADAVWDEASADHVATGSVGKLLSTAGAASDPLLTKSGTYASDTMGGKIQLIGTNTTVVISPIVNADISVIYGDDYYNADGRAVPLTSTQWVIADITPYTGMVRVSTPSGVVALPVVITAATHAYLQLTATQIASLGVGFHTYDFEVTKISDGHVATLQQGSFAVTEDVR